MIEPEDARDTIQRLMSQNEVLRGQASMTQAAGGAADMALEQVEAELRSRRAATKHGYEEQVKGIEAQAYRNEGTIQTLQKQLAELGESDGTDDGTTLTLVDDPPSDDGRPTVPPPPSRSTGDAGATPE